MALRKTTSLGLNIRTSNTDSALTHCSSSEDTVELPLLVKLLLLDAIADVLEDGDDVFSSCDLLLLVADSEIY